jgi:hypothetical protein
MSAMQNGLITAERAAEMVNTAKLLPASIVEAEVMSREELTEMQTATSGQQTAETPEGDKLL